MKNRKIAGIICEYNPFHTGHLYQIEKIREMGYENIVCVMSGNAVQRGEISLADKYVRAKIALCMGVDLVLELPFPYSSASAESFAIAGVRILDSIKADAICFGSENGDIELLRKEAEICDSNEFLDEYKKLSAENIGTAKAYFDAFKKVSGFELPAKSNDLLAIAYLRAIKNEKSSLLPLTIKRQGSDYSESNIEKLQAYPSASMLRNCIKKDGFCKISDELMPKKAAEILREEIEKETNFADISKLSAAILAFLRLGDEKIFANCAENSGGLCERIFNNAKLASSYDELLSMCASKKYTESRIKRAILFALTGVLKEDLQAYPTYSTVLALNSNGRKILSSVRKNSKIAFITKPADSVNLGEKAHRQRQLSDKIDALYTLALPIPKENYEYVRKSPFVKE